MAIVYNVIKYKAECKPDLGFVSMNAPKCL